MPDGLPTPHWWAFHMPKRGHSAEEYEDAFAAEGGRFAVADGASESAFAGLWARLLTAAFVRAADRPDDGAAWAAWLAAVRARWRAEVGDKELPWYAETKRDEGAFATFLGLELDAPAGAVEARWRAVAVGDACLFLVRAERLEQAFPLGGSAEFGNQPDLVGSVAGPGPRARTVGGPCAAGDRFLLMTDALAQWFWRETEARREPWRTLDRLMREGNSAETFPAWVEDLRGRQRLRNDDVTVLVVDIRP